MHTNVIAGEIWGWPTDAFAAWGQWAGGVGAVIAAGIALWIALRDGRRYETDRTDRDRAQARTIIPEVRLHSLGTTKSKFPSFFDAVAVVVDNHGTLPITEVIVESVQMSTESETFTQFRFGNDGELGKPERLCTVLASGGTAASPALSFGKAKGGVEGARDPSTVDYTVTCSFYDAQGYRWRRTDTEAPVRVV